MSEVEKNCKTCIYYDGGNGCHNQLLRSASAICSLHGHPQWKEDNTKEAK